MNKTRKAILPLAVLMVCILAAAALIATSPKVERRTPPAPQPTVEVLQATPTSYQVEVASYGTVSPRTQSTLVSEISGRIIAIAPNFRNGGFFKQNELLLTIDPRDYEIARIVARSELAQTQLQLREQEAQAEQARKDWKRLGDGAKPTDLVLRKPQLASNRAAVAAAQARLRQAEIDLERSRILAPYVGRVLEKNADVGQYVTQGTVLARIYAVDYVEIRLPLTDRQQAVLELPEIYRGEDTAPKPGPEVSLTAQVSGEQHTWQGRIVRTRAPSIPKAASFSRSPKSMIPTPGMHGVRRSRWANLSKRKLKALALATSSWCRVGCCGAKTKYSWLMLSSALNGVGCRSSGAMPRMWWLAPDSPQVNGFQ